MNELFKSAAKFMFTALAILIIGWTGWHTYSVLYAATKDNVQAIYGLLVFEAGTLIWFALFLKNAESIGQHLIALFGTALGAIAVIIAFFLSIQVDPTEISQYGSIGKWLIVAATAWTFIFVLLYELFNPKVWEELNDMIHDAMVMAKADKKAALMIEKESDELAEVLARNRKERVFAKARINGIKPVPEGANAPKPMQPQVHPIGMDVHVSPPQFSEEFRKTTGGTNGKDDDGQHRPS